MFVYKGSILFKAIASALVCLFSFTDIAWTASPLPDSARAALAPHTRLPDPEFREKFAIGGFLLSVDGVKNYINEQAAREKNIFNDEWQARRTEVVDIDNTWYAGRIKGGPWSPKSVVFIRLAGFLASTGQPAWIDLDGALDASKEFGGTPVIYIDSMCSKMPDACLEKHEIDEILQWEFLRINILNIADKKEMGNWIIRHIESSDSALESTEYKGMSSRQIAQLFHGCSYPIRDFYKQLAGTTDFDYGYIRDMLQMYGYDRNGKYPNIAAAEKEKTEPSLKTQSPKIQGTGASQSVNSPMEYLLKNTRNASQVLADNHAAGGDIEPARAMSFDETIDYLDKYPADNFMYGYFVRNFIRGMDDKDVEKIIRKYEQNPMTLWLAIIIAAGLNGSEKSALYIKKANEEHKNLMGSVSDDLYIHEILNLLDPSKPELLKVRDILSKNQRDLERLNEKDIKAVLAYAKIKAPKPRPRKAAAVNEIKPSIIEEKSAVDTGMGLREMSLDETYARLFHVHTNALKMGEIVNAASDVVPPYSTMASWSVTLESSTGGITYTLTSEEQTYGKGMTKIGAGMSSVYEMFERVSSFANCGYDWPGCYKAGLKLRKARYSELVKSGDNALDPNTMNFDTPYSDESIYWVNGEAKTEEGIISILISAQSVFCLPNFGDANIRTYSTNGLSAGNTIAEAKRQGLLEILERDGKSTVFYTPEKCFTLTADDTDVKRMLDIYKDKGINIQFLDLTTEFGVPIYKAFIKVRNQVIMGSGADLDGRTAVRRALGELLSNIKTYEHFFGTILKDTLFEPANKTLSFENLENYSTCSVNGDVDILERLLLANGYTPLYVDLTRKDLDIPVVRVIVPGLDIPQNFTARQWENFKSVYVGSDFRSEDAEPTSGVAAAEGKPDNSILKQDVNKAQGKTRMRREKGKKQPGSEPPSGRHNYKPEDDGPNVLPDDKGNADPAPAEAQKQKPAAEPSEAGTSAAAPGEKDMAAPLEKTSTDADRQTNVGGLPDEIVDAKIQELIRRNSSMTKIEDKVTELVYEGNVMSEYEIVYNPQNPLNTTISRTSIRTVPLSLENRIIFANARSGITTKSLRLGIIPSNDMAIIRGLSHDDSSIVHAGGRLWFPRDLFEYLLVDNPNPENVYLVATIMHHEACHLANPTMDIHNSYDYRNLYEKLEQISAVNWCNLPESLRSQLVEDRAGLETVLQEHKFATGSVIVYLNSLLPRCKTVEECRQKINDAKRIFVNLGMLYQHTSDANGGISALARILHFASNDEDRTQITDLVTSIVKHSPSNASATLNDCVVIFSLMPAGKRIEFLRSVDNLTQRDIGTYQLRQSYDALLVKRDSATSQMHKIIELAALLCSLHDEMIKSKMEIGVTIQHATFSRDISMAEVDAYIAILRTAIGLVALNIHPRLAVEDIHMLSSNSANCDFQLILDMVSKKYKEYASVLSDNKDGIICPIDEKKVKGLSLQEYDRIFDIHAELIKLGGENVFSDSRILSSGQSIGSATFAFRLMNEMIDIPAEEDINIMITFRCPFNCPMCLARDSKKEGHGREAKKEDLKKIFDQLRGFKKVHIVGTGEPLVYGKTKFYDEGVSADFIDIIRYAAERIDEVRIVTNGYLIPEDIVKAKEFFAPFPKNVVWLVSIDKDHEDEMWKRSKKSLPRLVRTLEELAKEGIIKTAYNIRLTDKAEAKHIITHFGLFEKEKTDPDNIFTNRIIAQGGAVQNVSNARVLDRRDVKGHSINPRELFLFIDPDGEVVTSDHVAYMTPSEREQIVKSLYSYDLSPILGNIHTRSLADIILKELLEQRFEVRNNLRFARSQTLETLRVREPYRNSYKTEVGYRDYSIPLHVVSGIVNAVIYYAFGDIKRSRLYMAIATAKDTEEIRWDVIDVLYDLFLYTDSLDVKEFVHDCVDEKVIQSIKRECGVDFLEGLEILGQNKSARILIENIKYTDHSHWSGFPREWLHRPDASQNMHVPVYKMDTRGVFAVAPYFVGLGTKYLYPFNERIFDIQALGNAGITPYCFGLLHTVNPEVDIRYAHEALLEDISNYPGITSEIMRAVNSSRQYDRLRLYCGNLGYLARKLEDRGLTVDEKYFTIIDPDHIDYNKADLNKIVQRPDWSWIVADEDVLITRDASNKPARDIILKMIHDVARSQYLHFQYEWEDIPGIIDQCFEMGYDGKVSGEEIASMIEELHEAEPDQDVKQARAQGKTRMRHTKGPKQPGSEPPSGRHNYKPEDDGPNVLPDDRGSADPGKQQKIIDAASGVATAEKSVSLTLSPHDPEEQFIELAKHEMQDIRNYFHPVNGACVRHSIELARRLLKHEISAEVWSDGQHFWCVANGYILDAYPEGARSFVINSISMDNIVIVRQDVANSAGLYQGQKDVVRTDQAVRYSKDDRAFYEHEIDYISLELRMDAYLYSLERYAIHTLLTRLADFKERLEQLKDNSKTELGTPAALLLYMFGYRDGVPDQAEPIGITNAVMPKDMANQRGGNDSLSNIYRELAPLERASLVEGDTGNPRYLPDWVLELDPEELIRQNPELDLPHPSDKQIDAVAARVIEMSRSDTHPAVLAAEAVESVKTEPSLKTLIEMSKDPERHIEAIIALSQINPIPDEAIPALIEASNDSGPNRADYEAHKALDAIGFHRLGKFVERFDRGNCLNLCRLGLSNPGKNFLNAAEYFNMSMVGSSMTWEKIIDLYEIFRGDRNNPQYSLQVRSDRLSTVRNVIGDSFLHLVNSKYDSQEEVFNAATQVYRRIVNQLFVDKKSFLGSRGLPGFDVVWEDPHDHPASGHHRLAWFMMNYLLINNGFTPLYLDRNEFGHRGGYGFSGFEDQSHRILHLLYARSEKNTTSKTDDAHMAGGGITTYSVAGLDIKNTLEILSKTIPEQERKDEGKYYNVRYNTTKIPQGSPAETLLKVYVNEVMPLWMPGKDRVRLIPSGSAEQSLISVECYKDQARSQNQKIGEGRVDIGEDITGKALRIPGMMNMALISSHIPAGASPGEIKTGYNNLASFIERQYKEISGADIPESTWHDTTKGICIILPRAERVPLEKVDEYYRLTIVQLRQSA